MAHYPFVMTGRPAPDTTQGFPQCLSSFPYSPTYLQRYRQTDQRTTDIADWDVTSRRLCLGQNIAHEYNVDYS